MKRGRPFATGKISSSCRNQKANMHSQCSMQFCACTCHLSVSELARIKGLRTVPKPGDPDYANKEKETEEVKA